MIGCIRSTKVSQLRFILSLNDEHLVTKRILASYSHGIITAHLISILYAELPVIAITL